MTPPDSRSHRRNDRRWIRSSPRKRGPRRSCCSARPVLGCPPSFARRAPRLAVRSFAWATFSRFALGRRRGRSMRRLALHDDDPYRALRPPEATGYRDLCACSGSPPVALMYTGSYNPIHCLNCNAEVWPDGLAFPRELAHEIASWRDLYSALETLWMRGTRSQRDFALRQLSGGRRPLHRRGLELVKRLSLYRPAYYWIFGYAPQPIQLHQCPFCYAAFSFYDGGQIGWCICDSCRLVT